MPDFYTWVILLNNQLEEIGEKQLSMSNGDLVYKFKRIIGNPNFSDQFKKIIKRYIKVGYNLNVM